MKAVYGLFPNPASAQDACDALRHHGSSMGIDTRKVVVVSSEPFEGYDFMDEHARSPMFPLAAIGGIVGGILGYALVAYTQKVYPLPTGGMPIVPAWTNGIIIYELTMLGAVVTTLITLFVTAGLPNYKAKLSDPEIWNGKIVVGVTDPPENARAALEAKFREAGAVAVKDYSS
jgi:xanthosine utilization system XapX-like protein